MNHEEKASEIVEQHLGYICVNQLDKDCPHCEAIKVISSALASAEKKGLEETKRLNMSDAVRFKNEGWNEAIEAALKALNDVVGCGEYSDCILEAESLIKKLKRG